MKIAKRNWNSTFLSRCVGSALPLSVALASMGLSLGGCAPGEMNSGLADEASDELDAGELDLGETSQALAQNCGDILTQGVYDELVYTRNSADRYALAKGFCKEASSSGSGGGGISVDVFKIVGVELTGSGESSSYSKYCEFFNSSGDSSESVNLMTRTVNKAVVAAWSACVSQRGGLACYARPGESVVGLTYEELANSGHLTGVTVSSSNMTFVNPQDASPNLYVGDTGILFSVPDPSRDATFVLNGRTSATNFAQSCTVRVKAASAVNAEIGSVSSRLRSFHKSIYTAMNQITSSDSSHTRLYRDRVQNAVLAQSNALSTNISNCSAGTACTMPAANAFQYSFKARGMKCGGVVKVPAQIIRRNVLAITPDQEVRAARNVGAVMQQQYNLCRASFKTVTYYDL